MSTTRTAPFRVHYANNRPAFEVHATLDGIDLVERVFALGLATAAEDLASAVADGADPDNQPRLEQARATVARLGALWVNGSGGGTRLERLRQRARREDGFAVLDELLIGHVFTAAAASRVEFGELKELQTAIHDGRVASIGEAAVRRGF